MRHAQWAKISFSSPTAGTQFVNVNVEVNDSQQSFRGLLEIRKIFRAIQSFSRFMQDFLRFCRISEDFNDF